MLLKEIKAPPFKNLARFEDGRFQRELYEKAIMAALEKINVNLDVFVDRYPHVSENLVYRPEENKLWTAAFFPGIAYLAFGLTGEKRFIAHAPDYLASFEWRLERGHTETHDLGFLYILSAVAFYKLTGDERARRMALRAAEPLAARYHEKGRYIQAWGRMGLGYPEVKIIIDTMMNLPLLYWASKETGDEMYFEIARAHAFTTSQYLVRNDASTYHTYLMDPATGEAVAGKTHQGRFDESTWARGQAWAVYGFALSYSYTKEPYFLHVVKETANFFINNLPADFVPYWDFSFNDMDPDLRDSSAAAIFACGLLELAKHLAPEERNFYLKVVYKIIASLYESYSTKDTPISNGLLLHGVYHREHEADECTIWGDYFYFEALVRLLLQDWKPFW